MPTITSDYEINPGSDGGSDDLVVVDVAKHHAWHFGGLHQLDELDVIRHHITHGPSNHRQPLSREGARKHVGKLVEQRHARDELYVAAFTNCRKQACTVYRARAARTPRRWYPAATARAVSGLPCVALGACSIDLSRDFGLVGYRGIRRLESRRDGQQPIQCRLLLALRSQKLDEVLDRGHLLR